MFYVPDLKGEWDYLAEGHPEFRHKPHGIRCLDMLPIYQTGVTLAALCRSGLAGEPAVERDFRCLMRLRGPGGPYYTSHWCACSARRWLNANAPKFDEKSARAEYGD